MVPDAQSTDEFRDEDLPGFAPGETDAEHPLGDDGARRRADGCEVTAQEIASIWGGVADLESDPGGSIKARARDLPLDTHLAVKPHHLVDAPAGDIDVDAQATPDFEIISPLGEGGMGLVYEARQTSVDRRIALKLIKPHLAANPQQRSKFLAEAAVTSDLDHPNIVPIHDLGVSVDGRLYYAMKRVRGTPWSEVIGRQTLEDNLQVLLGVCHAVAFAHSKGVIHRDLKPQNVMLGEFGEVYLMDWGLAVSVDGAGKAEPLTRQTAAGGTPAYMAPEMAFADHTRIGRHSDIYLLGAILYEIVTGSPPHPGGKVISCLMNAAGNRIAPARQQGELMEIALRAMSTDPAQRHGDVREFQEALRGYQAHAQSVRMVADAEAELAAAQRETDYERFAQAVYGMRAALRLWKDNDNAAAGLVRARLAYARTALDKGDLDLALSLLDGDEPAFREERAEVLAALAERSRRRMTLKVFKVAATLLVCAVFAILSSSYILIRRERDRALTAERAAVSARNRALAARAAEERQRRLAQDQRRAAVQARARALAARAEEQRQRELAQRAEASARQAGIRAEKALRQVLEARSRVEDARARALAARLLAARTENKLARTGMLLDSSWWSFGPAQARKRQQRAAVRLGKPVRLRLLLPGKVPLEMVLVPGGEFVMGSPASEQGRAAPEYLHRVRITRPFYMSVYELTVAQYRAVMGEKAPPAAPRPLSRAGAGAGAANMPQAGLSWRHVHAELLPALDRHAPAGYRFRLPTEAEWEYACRAGTTTAYCSGGGGEDLARVGWCQDNSGRVPHAVGGRQPNHWGLYDLHGNLSEWCEDAYSPVFYLRSPLDDPLARATDADGGDKGVIGYVVRGGSFMNLAEHCRSAYRSWALPDHAYPVFGVRLVLVPGKRGR